MSAKQRVSEEAVISYSGRRFKFVGKNVVVKPIKEKLIALKQIDQDFLTAVVKKKRTPGAELCKHLHLGSALTQCAHNPANPSRELLHPAESLRAPMQQNLHNRALPQR